MDIDNFDPHIADPSSTVNMVLKKAKTNLGKRALMKKAPKLVETEGKMCVMLHGGKSSQVLKNLITDLSVLKKGECHALTHNVGANDHLKHLTAQLFGATRLLELGDFKRHRPIGTERTSRLHT